MIRFDLQPGRSAKLLTGGAPEGHDARVVAALAERAASAGVVHVALDDARVSRLTELLAFFAPKLEVLEFPAWDCLPYDRVSPNAALAAKRVDALTRLLDRSAKGPGFVLLTTVNALSQKIMPRAALRGASFSAKKGQRIDVPKLTAFLAGSGYARAQTVREPGEFAVRGGIIDLFPPGSEEPLRLDLFGDELEAVRAFDPLTQRTTEARDSIRLAPVSEVLLDEKAIAHFRTGYRELFGAVNDGDPLYESVSAGRKHPGMEHWLPLFHNGLESLLDYAPKALVSLDYQADEAFQSRLAQIEDFYSSRAEMIAAEKKAGNVPYKPVPPGLLYFDHANWLSMLNAHGVVQLSPFSLPPGIQGQMDAGGARGFDFSEARNRPDLNVFDALRDHIAELRSGGRRVLVAGFTAGSRDRLTGVLADHGLDKLAAVETLDEARRLNPGIVGMAVLGLEHGFVSDDLAVIAEQDILGDRLIRSSQKKKRKSANFIAEHASLNPGDLVVHIDHGVGRYDGLATIDVSGAPHDCLRIIYDGGDKLFVPVENIEVLSRYGSDGENVTLDKLGGAGWQGRKARVKKRLKDMAEALLRIAAARELKHAEAVEPPEGLYQEFAARFPWPETDDQLKAIEEVFGDLASGKPMDRLVCGDVGFGKTEVALRAAFVVAMTGRQVAVIVPTTLLARQHYRGFTARFAGLPLRIGMLSRLVSAKDSAAAKRELEEGQLDIVIGTHALLSKTLRFKRLGMVIVDEEQHFGVKQKERLKEFRADVHVLTLTATPIPRTLQLALSGVRELSLIATPPVDRLAVRTFVLPYDPMVIREAILREHYRGGQCFYVCPRIEDLRHVKDALTDLVPEVKVVAAHGQMAATELEEVMTAFDEGQFQVLLATNIIESGLDIPNANTLVVHRADLFGLAQLYQIRGRVGRGKLRGYAYLTYQQNKILSQTAQQRLHVLQTLDNLGAGFQLASHDMDIRGAGNLLGEEQSGHIKEVGVELFQHMLEEAVAAARAGQAGLAGDEAANIEWTPQINLGAPVLIPEEYVADLSIRLSLYRRIGELVDRDEIEGFAAELIDRFGPLPKEVENLLDVIAVKQWCKQAGIERLDAGPKGAVLAFRDNVYARPDRLIAWISQQGGLTKLRPDHRLVYSRTWDDVALRVTGVKRLAADLATMAAADGAVAKADMRDLPPPVPPPVVGASGGKSTPGKIAFKPGTKTVGSGAIKLGGIPGKKPKGKW